MTEDEPQSLVQLDPRFGRHTPEGIPRVSPSQINKVLLCGADWRQTYLEKKPDAVGIKAEFGTWVHDALEAAWKNVLLGNDVDERSVEVYATEVATKWLGDADKVYAMSDGDEWLAEGKTDDEAAAIRKKRQAIIEEAGQVAAAVWTYMNEELGLQPVAMEENLLQFLDVDGTLVANKAYFDLLATDKNGDLVVVDYKTTGKSPSKEKDADGNETGLVQINRSHLHAMSVYADTLIKTGYDVKRAITVYAVRLKKGPRVVHGEQPITDYFLMWGRKVTETGVRMILSENLGPNPMAADWKCSKAYCAHFDYCPGSMLRPSTP